ncbi:hypothetical protein [Marinobacter nauticus]|jgi:hypothetical protein|uniref:hypothetical protein n=1 Tax=Marinobacter nauticus TaxID=2743 RepID=UPI00161A2B5D|nr:hypothetical protein [Marinobacter nauticus]MBW3199337.1 hypothetical protein [Marinobacter nauticus]MBY6184753.1 hypothetical protein [Marinobacter nauticus]
MHYDQTNSELTWEYGGHKQSVLLKAIEQYALDEQLDCIFALSGNGPGQEKLYVIEAKSGDCKSVQPPSGFSFYYLTKHPKLGVSIVCVSDEPVDGARDWHFSLQPGSIELKRAIPAY